MSKNQQCRHVFLPSLARFVWKVIFCFHLQLLGMNPSAINSMMTSSRDKGFIQISSDHPSIDVYLPRTLNTAPLLQINRLVWHYSSGTYRSVNVCIISRQVRATFTRRFSPGVWPWFARINWKKYHSIISIWATSLCKGGKGARPKIR